MENKENSMCPQCVEMMARAEKCIRERPGEAALTCLGAGYLLAQFPLWRMITALLRLVLFFLKPAFLCYGIYRISEDMRKRRLEQETTAQGEGAAQI